MADPVVPLSWARATAIPASQPGARVPRGGWMASIGSPQVVNSHAITEFEFHISPIPISSRPQTKPGTE